MKESDQNPEMHISLVKSIPNRRLKFNPLYLQDDDKARVDYERFLEELEEDPEMRAKVALYKDPTYVARPREEDTMTETDGEEPPQVPLEELLDELTLEEHEDEDEEMEG